jgi:hypothetical protein
MTAISSFNLKKERPQISNPQKISTVCLTKKDLKPQIPKISGFFDEGCEPDARLGNVGCEAALVVDGDALHVQPEDQLVLTELGSQFRNVSPEQNITIKINKD